MVIRASAGKQIDSLLVELASAHALTRDGAVARLTIIGERAVARLIDLAFDPDSSSEARVAAFHALEGIGDLRAFAPALEALDDSDGAVAVAAVGVLQVFLPSPRGMEALDRLTAIAVDRGRARGLRLAAIRALRDVGPTTIGPLLTALGSDPDTSIAMAAGLGPDAAADPAFILKEAADGTLPGEPAVLRLALTEAGAAVQPAVLQQVIERLRFREGAETGQVRADWMALRGAAHAALALKGSRAALYDLKETLESAREPLPVDFLGAVATIGDASCLDGLAAAYHRAMEAGQKVDDWWRVRLTDVFRTIATREQVTKKSAAGKRISAKWKDAAPILWG